jgi:hypothetical protein
MCEMLSRWQLGIAAVLAIVFLFMLFGNPRILRWVVIGERPRN